MRIARTVSNTKACHLLLAGILFISFQSFAQTDSWTLQPSNGVVVPIRANAASFTIGNKGYLGTGGAYSKDLWEYDPASGAWSQKADFGGIGRTYASGFSIGNKGYIGFGLKSSGYPDALRDFWEYDLASNKWTQKADVASQPRHSGLGFSIGGKGYLANGTDLMTVSSLCSEYDPQTDTWISKGASAQFFAPVSFTINGKAYLGIGGKSFFPSATTREFWEFDPVKNTIKRLADFPNDARVFATSFSLGGKGYFTGGIPGGGGLASNDLWQYDPISDNWMRRTSMPGTATQNTFAFSMADNAYIGRGTTESTPEVWKYQIDIAETPRVIYTGQNFVNLDWENFNTIDKIVAYDVYVNGEKKYTVAESEITADHLLPNTVYNFTVIGKYANGISTPASKPVAATTTNSTAGLKYRYYEGDWNQLPNFNALVQIRSAASPNVNINLRDPAITGHFGFVWEGLINIPVAGTYTFETVSSDGSKFCFNSFYNPSAAPLVNNDGIHDPFVPVAGSVNVTEAGLYPVALSYFAKEAGTALELYWTGPPGSGITRQLVPATAFIGNSLPPSDTIPPTTPANLKALTVTRNLVNLDWDNASDNTGVAFYDVYVNGTKKYTTTISELKVDSLTENTSYTFTVQSRDIAGNISDFSNTINVTTGSQNNGLSYRFYQGDWNTLPDFSSLPPVKTGVSANVDLSVRPSNVNDYFGFVWEGTINIPYPGTYTFETVSDDGSRIYFNSLYSITTVPLVNNDGVHGAWAPATGTVTVNVAGQYPIAITYFEKGSNESMQIYWTGPAGSGISRQLIPDYAFKGNYVVSEDIIPPVVPVNLKALTVSRNSIALDWDNASDNIGVASYDVYVNGFKKYTSLVSEIVADSLEVNTTYIFTIKAADLAGNVSAASSPLTVKTSGANNGLTYKYYEGNWDKLPDFNSLTPVKKGVSPNIDITQRPSNVNDHFGFLWEGLINIPVPGDYVFETVSDDGSRLYLGASYDASKKPLVENDGIHGAWTPVSGVITFIEAGRYAIAIAYFEKDGGESMQVYYTGPPVSGIKRQLIPDSAFREIVVSRDTITPTAPANLVVVAATRNRISLDWDNSTASLGMAYYNVYVDGIKKYTTTHSDIIIDSLSSTSNIGFTITATDVAGNTSPFSQTLNTNTGQTGNGLIYRYYEGNWDKLPDFNVLTPVKTGLSPNVSINVKPTAVNDHFGFVWEGTINIPVAGEYTFETVSDDGSKLYFNSLYSASATPVVNNDGIHGPWEPVSGKINIPKSGKYPFALSFFEKDGGEALQVYWTGPQGSGISRQLIPDSAFLNNYGLPADTAPPFPAYVHVSGVYSNGADIRWNDRLTGADSIIRYDIYVDGIKKQSASSTSTYVDGLALDTRYKIKLKAIYASGRSTAFSDEVEATTLKTKNGLDYRFYEGFWNTMPNFFLQVTLGSGTTPNVDISFRRPGGNDYFGFVWDGHIKIPVAGDYTFEILSDDGSNLYLSHYYTDKLPPVLTNDGVHAPTSVSKTFSLVKGLQPISMSYFEKDGGEIMEVYWSGPGIPRQRIPDSAFVRYKALLDTGTTKVATSTANVLSIMSDAFDESGIKIYPNPFNQGFKVNFNNSSASNKITVGIYDLTGRLISNRKLVNLTAGRHTINIDVSKEALAPGIYVVRLLENGNIIQTSKMVKAGN